MMNHNRGMRRQLTNSDDAAFVEAFERNRIAPEHFHPASPTTGKGEALS